MLVTRGPDAVLAKGSTIEMVLDRPLNYAENELMTGPAQPIHVDGGGPESTRKSSDLPHRRFPL